MKKTLYFLLVIVGLVCTSCHYDGRRINKLIDRINYHEVDLASKYVYPGDHASLFLFANEAMSLAPNLEMDVVDKTNYKNKEGEKFVITTIECKNTTQFFEDFVIKNHLSKDGKTIIDTFAIRSTQKKDFVSFDWGIKHAEPENMFPYKTHAAVQVFSKPNKSSQKIFSIPEEKEIVCKRIGQDTTWYECFYIAPTGERLSGYINYHEGEKLSTYFTMGFLEGLGIIIMLVVTLVFVIIPILFWRINPIVGIVCVLISIFLVYNMLAHLLFELFLIHLPYAI